MMIMEPPLQVQFGISGAQVKEFHMQMNQFRRAVKLKLT